MSSNSPIPFFTNGDDDVKHFNGSKNAAEAKGSGESLKTQLLSVHREEKSFRPASELFDNHEDDFFSSFGKEKGPVESGGFAAADNDIFKSSEPVYANTSDKKDQPVNSAYNESFTQATIVQPDYGITNQQGFNYDQSGLNYDVPSTSYMDNNYSDVPQHLPLADLNYGYEMKETYKYTYEEVSNSYQPYGTGEVSNTAPAYETNDKGNYQTQQEFTAENNLHHEEYLSNGVADSFNNQENENMYNYNTGNVENSFVLPSTNETFIFEDTKQSVNDPYQPIPDESTYTTSDPYATTQNFSPPPAFPKQAVQPSQSLNQYNSANDSVDNEHDIAAIIERNSKLAMKPEPTFIPAPPKDKNPYSRSVFAADLNDNRSVTSAPVIRNRNAAATNRRSSASSSRNERRSPLSMNDGYINNPSDFHYRPNEGKHCSLCKSVNLLTANFCYNCGVRLYETSGNVNRVLDGSLSQSPSYDIPIFGSNGSVLNGITSSSIASNSNKLSGELNDSLLRRGCPLVNFGFGGKIVVVHTKTQQAFDPSLKTLESTMFSGPVFVHSVSKILNTDKQVGVKFPIEKMKKKELLKLFNDCLDINNVLNGPFKKFSLTIRLLKLLAENDGKMLSSDAVSKFLQNLSGSTQNTKTNIVHYDQQFQDEALVRVRLLLQEGKREEAINIAKSNGLWTIALIVASRVDKSIYNGLIKEYASLTLSTDDPLHTIFHLFGGSVDEFEGPFDFCNEPDIWVSHLKTILMNRTTKDSAVLLKMAKSLRKFGKVDESNVCIILSGVLFENAVPDQLLLSDGGFRRRVLDEVSLFLNEALEAVIRFSNNSFVLPALQVTKLLAAFDFMEKGKIEVSANYCEILANLVKSNGNKPSSWLSPKFLNDLKDLNFRLSGSGIDTSNRQSFGWLSKNLIFDAIDKGITSMIEGDSKKQDNRTPITTTKTPQPQSEPKQYTNSYGSSNPYSIPSVSQLQSSDNNFYPTGNDVNNTYQYNYSNNSNPSCNPYEYSNRNYDQYSTQTADYYQTNNVNAMNENNTQYGNPEINTIYNPPTDYGRVKDVPVPTVNDELGFSNSSMAPKATKQDVKEPVREEKKEQVKENDDGRQKLSESSYASLIKSLSGLTIGLFGRKSSTGSNQASGGPVVANLGESNSFYYDENLKRWVNKNADTKVNQNTTAPLSPPKALPPIAPPSTPNVHSLQPSRTTSPMPRVPSSSTSFSDTLNSQPTKRGTIRRNARSRYVDTLNPESSKNSSLSGGRPSIPIEFINENTAAIPRIMSPPQKQ